MYLLSITVSGQDTEFYLFNTESAARLYLAGILKESAAEYKILYLNDQHINNYNHVRENNVYGIDIQT